MKENKIVVEIDKPAAEVYAFYINPLNTPKWIDSIKVEKTSEWPIRIGTIYRNQDINGAEMEYRVTDLKENELFELTSKDGGYHVRYMHKALGDGKSELEYYEWVEKGEIEKPFTKDILLKLKQMVEK